MGKANRGGAGFRFENRVWLYPGAAAWHFVSVPKRETKKLRELFSGMGRAWGSLPVTATIGKTSWKTSIFPDSKSGSYLLPIKADVRKREGIAAGDKVLFSLDIRL